MLDLCLTTLRVAHCRDVPTLDRLCFYVLTLGLQVAVGALLGVVTGYLVGITWHSLGMPS